MYHIPTWALKGEVPGSACGDANRHPWDATADGGCPPGASGTGRGEGCSCERRGAGSLVGMPGKMWGAGVRAQRKGDVEG